MRLAPPGGDLGPAPSHIVNAEWEAKSQLVNQRSPRARPAHGTFRRVAPTVAPPSLAGLVAGLGALALPDVFSRRLEDQIRRFFPQAAQVVTTQTGRAALARAIRMSLEATGRSKVVLPAYTSFSVASAAAASGAIVDLCDLDPTTLDFDRRALRRLVGSDTAAVVLGNLFGYPSATHDLGWIRAGGTLLIDDAAQALGAREHGRPVGSRGELGILSLGRGKCVSTGAGGALLVNAPELVSWVAPRSSRPARGMANWVVAAGSAFCVNTLAFGLLSRLPGTRVGESHFDPVVADAPAPAAANGLAIDLRAAAERAMVTRTRVASGWKEVLRDYGVTTARVADGVTPSYLRVPLIARDEEQRDLLVTALAERSFTYVGSYPCSLGEIAAFAKGWVDRGAAPAAAAIARRLIALPCHQGVTAARLRAAKQGIAAVVTKESRMVAARVDGLGVKAAECKT